MSEMHPEPPTHHSGGGIGAGLTRKIGPLPAWVWALAIGTTLGLYLRHRNAANTTAYTQSPSTTGNVTTADPSAGNLGTDTSGNSPSSLLGTYTRPTTNEEWSATALRYLISMGWDPNVANQAIANYLNGQPETAAQLATIGQVLVAIGPPPGGVIPYAPGSADPVHPIGGSGGIPPGTVVTVPPGVPLYPGPISGGRPPGHIIEPTPMPASSGSTVWGTAPPSNSGGSSLDVEHAA